MRRRIVSQVTVSLPPLIFNFNIVEHFSEGGGMLVTVSLLPLIFNFNIAEHFSEGVEC